MKRETLEKAQEIQRKIDMLNHILCISDDADCRIRIDESYISVLDASILMEDLKVAATLALEHYEKELELI